MRCITLKKIDSKNKSTIRVAVSFGCDISTIFGKIENIASSTAPLPLSTIKSYVACNAPENHSGIKQRILNEMNNSFVSITSDISFVSYVYQ